VNRSSASDLASFVGETRRLHFLSLQIRTPTGWLPTSPVPISNQPQPYNPSRRGRSSPSNIRNSTVAFLPSETLILVEFQICEMSSELIASIEMWGDSRISACALHYNGAVNIAIGKRTPNARMALLLSGQMDVILMLSSQRLICHRSCCMARTRRSRSISRMSLHLQQPIAHFRAFCPGACLVRLFIAVLDRNVLHRARTGRCVIAVQLHGSSTDRSRQIHCEHPLILCRLMARVGGPLAQ